MSKTTHPKDSRKLNLDVPLLSTRRTNGPISQSLSRVSSCDSHNMVPFSWELSAGKPKETGLTKDVVDDPPPRLPPGRKFAENEYDVDDLSDYVDTFSLSAAIDIVESAEMAKRNGNMLDGVSLDDSCGNQSPSFIIQRFLSDAKALAVSSGLPIPNNISDQNEKCKPRIINASPKGWRKGINGLFPWRTKHKASPCGVKSPVRVTSASVKSQWGWKPRLK